MLWHAIPYIARTDKRCPDRLRQIPNPPAGLYLRGNHPELLSLHRLLAVVGNRLMSVYGSEVTKHLVTGLVRFGYGNVSGLALGIDAVAHTAALDSSGVTIAVLVAAWISFHRRPTSLYTSGFYYRGELLFQKYSQDTAHTSNSLPHETELLVGFLSVS